MKKNELLKECAKQLNQPNIKAWYQKNLTGKPQYKTINALTEAIEKKELSLKEALSIALIVGVQWKEKFVGVP
jgi:hypothetical protein